MTFLYSLLLALDLGLPVASDFLMFFSLDVGPDEPEFKLEAIRLFTWKWSFFNFPFAEKVSPSPSIPALQLRKYCNEWMKWGLYQILNCEKCQIFFLIKCRIYLGAVENRRCSSPTIQIAVCQSADGLRVSPLKLCHFPHKSLLQKPIMALKQNNKHKTLKKLSMVTELALLFVEDWHLFEKTKAKVFETGGQEGNLYEEKASLRGNIGTPRHKRFFLKTCTSALRVCIWVAL